MPGEVEDVIRQGHAKGWSPAQVVEDLRKRGPQWEVSPRTVQRMLRQLGGQGPAWRLTLDEDPEDARISQDIAAWAVQLSRVRPNLPPGLILFLAPIYDGATLDELTTLTASLARMTGDYEADFFSSEWMKARLVHVGNAAKIAAKPKDAG